MLAARVSVAVTVSLASRTRLHAFANEVLSPDELRDGLILAASAPIVLPLAPSTPIEWLGGLDLRQVWGVVVLLLAIQAGRHVALRVLGPQHGWPSPGSLAASSPAPAPSLHTDSGHGSPHRSSNQLQLMLLLAISTNTASKLVTSLTGGRRYALRVMPGLLLGAGAAWAASIATGRV